MPIQLSYYTAMGCKYKCSMLSVFGAVPIHLLLKHVELFKHKQKKNLKIYFCVSVLVRKLRCCSSLTLPYFDDTHWQTHSTPCFCFVTFCALQASDVPYLGPQSSACSFDLRPLRSLQGHWEGTEVKRSFLELCSASPCNSPESGLFPAHPTQ